MGDSEILYDIGVFIYFKTSFSRKNERKGKCVRNGVFVNLFSISVIFLRVKKVGGKVKQIRNELVSLQRYKPVSCGR